MDFEETYRSFIKYHLRMRKGERYRRLKEGHGNAEKMFLNQVWWPLFHQFQYLHPEYEVDDFKDGKRYLDFAYLRSRIRVSFEIDGYGPHLKNIGRRQFSDNLDRQNQLVLDGWIILRFSYDQVIEKPRRCQQVTQHIIGKLLG
jgi:very-short-patch-repair endonuclease